MVTVNTTVKKLKEFIEDLESGQANSIIYQGIQRILLNSLRDNVFVESHYDVFEIPTQSDLEMLIQQGGRSHRPGQPREAHYSKEYLEKKRSMNLGPHQYKRMGFKEGVQVNRDAQGVEIKVPIEAVTEPRSGYTYGVIHESKKSVIKYAFLSVWQEIIDYIKNKYKEMLS